MSTSLGKKNLKFRAFNSELKTLTTSKNPPRPIMNLIYITPTVHICTLVCSKGTLGQT